MFAFANPWWMLLYGIKEAFLPPLHTHADTTYTCQNDEKELMMKAC